MSDSNAPHVRGRFFEEFHVGDVVVSAGRTVTDADLVMFVGLSGNASELHVDERYAKSLGLPGRVVHGLLTLSMLSGLLERTGLTEGTIVAHLGMDEVRFVEPVFVGDTLRAKMEIIELRSASGGSDEKRGIVKMRMVGLNQNDREVLRSTQTIMVRCRPDGADAG